MKKILTIFMCMAMFMCFMPSMAFADTPANEAKIGSTEYATLQAAIDAAEDGATIELLRDVTDGGGVIVTGNKNFTLNFNNHSYEVTHDFAGSYGTKNQCFQLLQGSNLIFENGTITGATTGLKMVIQNYSNLTLKNMTINGATLLYALSNNCGIVNLTGSTSVNGKVDVSYWPSAYPDGTQVTINTTGTITGNIELGLYGNNNTSENKMPSPSQSILNIMNVNHEGTISVILGSNSYKTGLSDEEGKTFVKNNVHIYGGAFSSDPSEYVPNTHMVTGTTTSKVAIKPAQIGSEYYKTLQAAVDAAADGATIELLADIVGDGVRVPSGKVFTLDFKGFKYTVNANYAGSPGTETQCFQLLEDSTLTFKDGTIEADGPGIGMVVQNYSNLTLDNMKIDGSSLSQTNWYYTLSNNCGTVVLKNGTKIIEKNTPDGDKAIFAMDSCKFGSYDAPTVTVEAGVEITGKIEVSGGNLNIQGGTITGTITKSSGNVNITGGTFSSDPKAYVTSGYEVKGTAAPYTVSRIYVPSAPSGPVETPDPVVNDKTSETTTAKIEPTTVGGKTTATVDTKTANTIVDKAIENKSSEVVINASGSTPVTPSTTPVESKVELPTAAVKDIVEKTDANIVVKTDAATIELDQTAAQAVADKAGEAEKVNLVVETKAEKEDQVVIELKIETASGNVTDFKGGNVKVTVNIPKALEGKKVVCVYVDENGNYTKMEGKLNNDGTYTFVTGHFSTYVVMTEEEAAAAIEAQKSSKIAAGVQATTLKVRSSAAKGKITVKWTKSKGFKVDYYQVFKATKKNGTFKYLAKTTKLQLVNKKGLKAGKTYYFKVRGVRVVDGAKIYTNWSKLAIRKAK